MDFDEGNTRQDNEGATQLRPENSLDTKGDSVVAILQVFPVPWTNPKAN